MDKLTRKELLLQIEEFLSERRGSEYGGWAEITKQDMTDLSLIIKGLIRLKCEDDADGDVPIEFALCNRRENHFAIDPYFITLPYHADEYDDDQDRVDPEPFSGGSRLTKLAMVAQQASSQLDRELTYQRWKSEGKI